MTYPIDNPASVLAIYRPFLLPTTIDLNQAAGAHDLYTCIGSAVWVDAFIIRMSGGAIGGALTSIMVHTDDTTPIIIIDAISGAVANLTSQNQLSATGPFYVALGKKIQLTIAGGAAGVARVCDVVVCYRPIFFDGALEV